MLRKIYATLTALVIAGTAAFAQQSGGILKGKIFDKSNNEAIPFANVAILNGGVPVLSGVSDIEGNYTLKPIPAGKYNVKATFVGYQTFEVTGVLIYDGKTTYYDVALTSTTQQLDVVEIVEYLEPLIDPDTKSGGTVTREEYQNMPSKNINSVASTTAGVFQSDEGSSLNVRGSRSEGTDYYVDGQKIIGSGNLPQSSIEQVSVITGGLPAMYGDATGGVISITTRGPQNIMFGGLEAITSQLYAKPLGDFNILGDPYGYNFLGFSLGGPLVSKTDSSGYKQSILGYIISGEVVTSKDNDPSALGLYKVKDDVLDRLQKNPLRLNPLGTGTLKNAEFLTKDSLEKIKAKENVRTSSARLNVKVDYKPSRNMNLTFGGSIDYNKNHGYDFNYSLFNNVNNAQNTSYTWRAYAKITQKFGSDDKENKSNIKNAYFSLQISYSQTASKTEDDTHKDNLFNYGHVGKFTTYKGNAYEFLDSASAPGMNEGYYQTGFIDTLVSFEEGPHNEYTSSYTNQYFSLVPGNPRNLSQIQQGGGLLNGDRPSHVYSLFFNTGRQYNGYALSNGDQFRVFTNFSADVKNHAIQVGFEYEQRNSSSYSVGPIGLWSLGRLLTNKHITQMDTSATPTLYTTINGYNYYTYPRKVDATSQSHFDKSVRDKFNLKADEWIDLDSYNPEDLSIDLFSPDELLNDGNSYVGHYGYDVYGNKLKGSTSFEDFFNKKDANGNFTRNIGSYQPIYIAGYIQDKFDFRDLKFNVGLRVDRFDANQKVLKDKYLLFETKTVGEVSNLGAHPDNMGDDYVVYVDNANSPTKIVGYRNGDIWYNEQGIEVQDPTVIADASQTGFITPYLVNPNDKLGDETFLKAFKDYDPQITVMPRIAFSFPISDVANFFAHYDVLTQRPQSFMRLDPTDYYYITNRIGQVLDNPDLKPERTTDYELGFSQTLSEKKNSAITMSAFYREMRDMIQVINVNQAYPITYTTFGNIDFGTVKGFSVSYDLRRSGGVQLTASYTLQFADGTGSSATDGLNLVTVGYPNLRTTIPLDFDQRHAIVTNVDYRFGSGKNYRGSEKMRKVLENVGGNIVFRAGSGLPYSRTTFPNQSVAFGINQRTTLKGSPNGSNLPWQYRMDLRIDKNFPMTFGKGEGDKKKTANLNVYLQVLNVLNTQNVVNVYTYTGNPTDDGWLASAEAQNYIASQVSPMSYVDLYQVKVANPNYYSIPRRIRLGVLFDF